MPTIAIQATDTLFFRDGRPFSMGDDSFAQGIFPPPPSVIYGALRSAYLAKGLEDELNLTALIKESEDLRIQFMSMQVGSSQYFPMPMDLVVPKKNNQNEHAFPLELTDAPAFSNAVTPKNLKSNYDGKMEDEPLLLESGFLENYLHGNFLNLKARKRADFMTTEAKIGIGRDKDRNTADDGKLFRIQANRLASDGKNGVQKMRFLLHFTDLEMPENGWLALGGERRVAFFEKADSLEVARPVLTIPVFKIYLATPAVFAAGWQPEILLKKHGLTLLAAAFDRPLSVGGWDIEKKRPKPMVKCLPSGSVFYVKAASLEAAKEAAEAIHGQSIADNLNHTDYQKQGFGLAFIGKINQNA